MHNPKSPIEKTNEWLEEKRRAQENARRSEYTGTTDTSRALAAVAELAEQDARGDLALARQARELLDTLCWTPDGYPEPVRAALRAAGLRETP